MPRGWYKISSNITSDRPLESWNPQEYESRIHNAYLIVGVYLFLVAVCNLLLFMQVKKYKRVADLPEKVKTLFPQKRSKCKQCLAWVLFVLFNVCFGGVETIYSGLLFTFASSHVGMDNAQSSLLVSMLFVSYSIGRFSAVFTTQCIPTHYILLFDLICGLAAGSTLSYYTMTSATALWICTLLQGIGSSTIFATALLWAKDFVTISGRFTSTYVIAYTVGMMSWPALTGYLLQTVGAQWFPYMGAILSTGCMFWFSILWMLSCTHFQEEENKEKQQDLIASLHSLHAV